MEVFKITDEQNERYSVMYSNAINTLTSSDPILKKLIEMIGTLQPRPNIDYFPALLTSIIGQQLSSKAANTIRNRVSELCGSQLNPEIILKLSKEDLRSVGLSNAKIEYIKDLAKKVYINEIDFESISQMENEKVITTLTQIKGIGQWTAEMFLIFSLKRMNVMSYADSGLQRAARWLYRFPENPKINYLQEIDYLWSPFRSIASLYLWESIDRGFVDSGSTLDELYLQSKRNPD
jgi:DNA-3-methyladenine glycosylase II